MWKDFVCKHDQSLQENLSDVLLYAYLQVVPNLVGVIQIWWKIMGQKEDKIVEAPSNQYGVVATKQSGVHMYVHYSQS